MYTNQYAHSKLHVFLFHKVIIDLDCSVSIIKKCSLILTGFGILEAHPFLQLPFIRGYVHLGNLDKFPTGSDLTEIISAAV